MPMPRRVFSSFLMIAMAAGAQPKHRTDAQVDGFEGAIHTVATRAEVAPVKWQQPSGPTVVMPLFCRDCAYDPDGSRTKSGQTLDSGEFVGEEINLTRDGLGHIIARTRVNVSDGKIIQQETDGPFGPVQEIYSAGPVARSTKSYDRLGNLSEWLSFDASGQQVSRSVIRTNPDGQWTERAAWGKDGQLTYRETYDPDTDFQHFETYDDSGAVKLTFTFSHDKVQTFWSATEEPNQYGSSVVANKGKGDFDQFLCHQDGHCDVNHVHYAYADSTKQNPMSVEWRNSDGMLLYAAYYQYDFDAQHNWTKRSVWVLSPEIPERTLYETDTRVITYWN